VLCAASGQRGMLPVKPSRTERMESFFCSVAVILAGGWVRHSVLEWVPSGRGGIAHPSSPGNPAGAGSRSPGWRICCFVGWLRKNRRTSRGGYSDAVGRVDGSEVWRSGHWYWSVSKPVCGQLRGDCANGQTLAQNRAQLAPKAPKNDAQTASAFQKNQRVRCPCIIRRQTLYPAELRAHALHFNCSRSGS